MTTASSHSTALAVSTIMSFALIKFKLDVYGYFWEIVVGTMFVATLIILYKIYIWRKNVLILTNQRVILNIRHGAFSQTVTELLYRDIHDISFKQVGLSALMNRYGKLIIKTPSGNEITFDRVPSSASVVEIINGIRRNMEIDKYRN